MRANRSGLRDAKRFFGRRTVVEHTAHRIHTHGAVIDADGAAVHWGLRDEHRGKQEKVGMTRARERERERERNEARFSRIVATTERPTLDLVSSGVVHSIHINLIVQAHLAHDHRSLLS